MNEQKPSGDLPELLHYLKQNRAFDFNIYKRTTLERRIRQRLAAVAAPDYRSYIDYLEVHPGEFDLLFWSIPSAPALPGAAIRNT